MGKQLIKTVKKYKSWKRCSEANISEVEGKYESAQNPYLANKNILIARSPYSMKDSYVAAIV